MAFSRLFLRQFLPARLDVAPMQPPTVREIGAVPRKPILEKMRELHVEQDILRNRSRQYNHELRRPFIYLNELPAATLFAFDAHSRQQAIETNFPLNFALVVGRRLPGNRSMVVSTLHVPLS